MTRRSTWILVVAILGGAVPLSMLSFSIGRYGHDLAYRAGLEAAAEASPDCPPYPGAEQHPVEDWVCETEEEWAEVLGACNEESNAAHALMEIVGDQERELDWWRLRCTPRDDDKMKDIARDTAEAVRNMAAERAIRRKNEEDEQK